MEYDKIIKILDSYGNGVETEMIDILNASDSINLQKTIGYEVEENDKNIKLVLSMASYGLYADSGRSFGVIPPKKDIEEWMRERMISMDYLYPIMLSIARKGTEHSAKNFLHVMYEDADYLKADLKKQMKEDIAFAIYSDFSDFEKKY